MEEDKAVNHLQRVKNRNEQLEAEMNLFKEQSGMYAVEPTQDPDAAQGGEHSNGKDCTWWPLSLYRVTHLVANLGWVDFNLGCSTILLGE